MSSKKKQPARARVREAAVPAPPARMPAWVAPGVYAVLAVILFREFVLANGKLLGVDTLALSYFARTFYTEAVREGFPSFPLWQPFLFGGLPFVDGMHGDIFYPLSIAMLILDPVAMWGWKMVLHVFLAGVFTYVWLRELGCRREPALFGGLVYMLGADLVSLVLPGGDGKLMVSALAPLAFWLTERAARHGRPRDYAFLALGVALLLFTSHMQLAYFSVWGISLYFFFRLAQRWRTERRAGAALARAGLFALAGILGVAAAAVQFAPPLRYLREWSHRAEKTVAATEARGYEYSTTWSLHPEEAVSLVVPEFVGTNVATEDESGNTYWGRNPFKLNHEYAGLIPLLLVPLVFLRRREGRSWFFLALGGLAVLYALGATTPAFRFFYLLPGVRLFRAPSLIIFLYGLSLATLAALGLQRWLDSLEQREDHAAMRRTLWGAAGLLGVLALLASSGVLLDVWTAVVYSDIAPNKLAALDANTPSIKLGFGVAFVFALLVAAVWEGFVRGLLSRTFVLSALLLLAFVDLYRVDRPFVEATVRMNERTDPVLFAADESIEYLRRRAVGGEVFRALDAGAYQQPNTLAIHGIEQLGGHHGNEIGRYRELLGGEGLANLGRASLRLLDLTNTAYVLTPQPIQEPGLVEVFRGSRSVVYRNDRALPRAYLIGETEVVADAAAVDRLLAPEFDARRFAVLDAPLPATVRIETGPRGSVEWSEHETNRQVLRVRVDRPALLMLIENYYPAWKAEVDGRAAPVLRANYVFRAVPIPPGEHRVTLRYESPLLRASALTSGSMILLLLGVAAADLLHARRRRGRS